MKLLSMDYGRRRIGIATTDETGTLIRGLTTIDRKVSKDPIADILAIISTENPSSLIVGLPLDHENEETEMTSEIRSFVSKILEKIVMPVHFIDESYSSIEAAGVMRFRKKKDRRDKTAVDGVAACLILERYFDQNRSSVTDWKEPRL
jgi:putative holliday junction resolvase